VRSRSSLSSLLGSARVEMKLCRDGSAAVHCSRRVASGKGALIGWASLLAWLDADPLAAAGKS